MEYADQWLATFKARFPAQVRNEIVDETFTTVQGVKKECLRSIIWVAGLLLAVLAVAVRFAPHPAIWGMVALLALGLLEAIYRFVTLPAQVGQGKVFYYLAQTKSGVYVFIASYGTTTFDEYVDRENMRGIAMNGRWTFVIKKKGVNASLADAFAAVNNRRSELQFNLYLRPRNVKRIVKNVQAQLQKT